MDFKENALRARLNEIAGRFSQAEIARRTGQRGSTVSRYLSGNRIPAVFVESVGREFGVNPAWLLYGEGAPWLTDVVADQGKTATGLVELVQTMGRLSKLKLGALAGKQSALNLRELNDALEAFERVRERLARQSRETYVQVLDDWNAAIGARDKAACARLAKAAEQVSRLCPDEELTRRHEQLRGAHEYVAGSVERALLHRRRSFYYSLTQSGEVDERVLVEAFSVVVTLDAIGRTAEAARFGEAALKLATGAASWANYGRCVGALGWVQIQLGNLRRGMHLTAQALARPLNSVSRQNCLVSMVYAQFLAGALELPLAAQMLAPEKINFERVFFFSPWASTADALEKMLVQYNALRGELPVGPGARIARTQMLSLQGKHDKALEVWAEAENDQEARDHNPSGGLDFTLRVMRTQLLRRAGREKEARNAFEVAEAARKAVPTGITLDLNWRRVHWRNALAIGTPVMRRGAEKFDRFCKRRGIVFGPD